MLLSIKFKENDLKRYMRALENLQMTALGFCQDEMQRRCAVDYFQLVVKNLMAGNRPGPAYTPRYRTWKYEYGWEGYPSPRRLRGDLVRSLTAFRKSSGHGWAGGVPPGAMDAGGKSWFGKGADGPKGKSKSIGMYGWVMEHGGSWPQAGTHPKRPIFEPTAKEYASEGWGKRGKEALDELKKGWA